MVEIINSLFETITEYDVTLESQLNIELISYSIQSNIFQLDLILLSLCIFTSLSLIDVKYQNMAC